MKKLLFTLFIPLSLNAQTSLYESDDFTDWTVYNPSEFGNETYNPGDLLLQGADPDTIRIDIVKEFISISGLDSIQVNFHAQATGGSNCLLDIYTSNDSINWTPVSLGYDTHVINDSITIYQSDLNIMGSITYLRFQIGGYNYVGGIYNFQGHVYDVDIKTNVDMTNSIDELESDVKIFGDDGYIKIESESILESIDVFSLDGRLIYQNENLNDYKTTIHIPKEGIYIVNVNGICSKKIFIK